MSATTAEGTKAQRHEGTKGKCTCAEIREAMSDGVCNPEGIEEYREAFGHYPDCPRATEPIYFIHRRKGVKYYGEWYNSPSIQRHVGSGVMVREDPDNPCRIILLDSGNQILGTADMIDQGDRDPFQHLEFSIQNSPAFIRLGAYDCVHPGSFIVGRFGVMVNGRFYNNPILEKHIAARVRVAITPDPVHLAILHLDGKHICEAVQIDHAEIGNAEGELMYRLEITDQLLRYLRELISVSESERADLHRRLETQRITRQLAGRVSPQNPTCTCGACFDSDTFAQANAAHAKRLEEDDSQPGPDCME